MKSSLAFVLGLASSAASFPWLREDFSDHAKRGLEVVKKDPELVSLLQSLYKDQLQERDDFFAAMASYTEGHEEEPDPTLEKRTTANCLPHTLPDFLPSNITGLKKFPEAAYPYKDPTPSDQRGPCPGMNTLANASLSLPPSTRDVLTLFLARLHPSQRYHNRSSDCDRGSTSLQHGSVRPVLGVFCTAIC
jgi:hypothetical protein